MKNLVELDMILKKAQRLEEEGRLNKAEAKKRLNIFRLETSREIKRLEGEIAYAESKIEGARKIREEVEKRRAEILKLNI